MAKIHEVNFSIWKSRPRRMLCPSVSTPSVHFRRSTWPVRSPSTRTNQNGRIPLGSPSRWPATGSLACATIREPSTPAGTDPYWRFWIHAAHDRPGCRAANSWTDARPHGPCRMCTGRHMARHRNSARRSLCDAPS